MPDEASQEQSAERERLEKVEQAKGWLVDVPEYYVDTYDVSANPYTITLHFGTRRGPGPHTPKLRVQMSPQHAKVMSLLFHRAIREVEEQIGEISLPHGFGSPNPEDDAKS